LADSATWYYHLIIILWRILMEKKTARLTVLIDPDKKKALEELCLQQDVTPSQVVRQLIRDYLQKHQVDYPSQPTHANPRVDNA